MNEVLELARKKLLQADALMNEEAEYVKKIYCKKFKLEEMCTYINISLIERKVTVIEYGTKSNNNIYEFRESEIPPGNERELLINQLIFKTNEK